MTADKHSARDSSRHDSAEAAVSPRTLNRARDLALAFLRKSTDDDVSIRAMSLTYTTILSLVPLLAVVFSVLKAFGVHNQIEPLLARTLAPLGPEGASLGERIVEFVHNMQVGVLGAIGLAGLFYTVVTLVSSVEDALNRIWRVRHGRDWASKFRDYLSVVTVGPVLMFSALALIASAQQHAIVQSVLAFAPWLMWVLTELLPYSMLCGGFTLLFRFMPNTAVTWRAAFVGGLAGGIAWKLAGSAFASFVASSARYAAIYSSFAIIVLFFIWIYVSWLIVLIAGEIAYLWQNPTDVLSRLRDVSIAAQEKNGLAILVAVARQHLAGKPPLTTESLTLATELPATTVDHIVDQMIDHAVLLESGRPSGIALARPPESIAVAELLGILRGEIGAEPFRETPDTIERAFARRKAAVTSALEGMTLRSLAEPPADATPAATNPPPGGDSSVPRG